ncbi:MAG: DUF502 domain-containing protein [Phycisphaerales bacterium]|nr:DUF502 domain-containing protein [Phycisphaerales bacterium]
MISYPTTPEADDPSQASRTSPSRSALAAVGHFFKSTILGGLLFLIPIVLTIVILREAFRLVVRAFRALTRFLPAETVAGIVVADAAAVLAITVVCFALGLFVGTRIGRSLSSKLERTVLRKVPGYSLLKSATHSVAGEKGATDVSVALARIEDAWTLAFVMERHNNGLYTVFVPSAPTPAAGSIYYLTEDRVRPLENITVAAVSPCIMRLGVGSAELLKQAGDRSAERRIDAGPASEESAEPATVAKDHQ